MTNYSQNPWIPGITADAFLPDQLIAGDLKIVTEAGSVGGSALLARGTVMGRITATGVWIKSVETATDGSQIPAGILVDQCDCTTTSPQPAGIYVMGEFNFRALTYDSSWGTAGSNAALIALRGAIIGNIIIKTSISAADPS